MSATWPERWTPRAGATTTHTGSSSPHSHRVNESACWSSPGTDNPGAPVKSVKGEEGKQALDRWISWARRCRIPVFVELAGRIVRHRQAIDAALDHGLSQGLIESTNTKIRVLTRVAFGFHSAEALIALAMLALGGHRPALPGRA